MDFSKIPVLALFVIMLMVKKFKSLQLILGSMI